MIENLGIKLRTLRRNKHLSQAKLGRILGLSQTTIANYESNTREPDLGTLIRLAQFYGVSVDYLLGCKLDDLKFPELTEKQMQFVRELASLFQEENESIQKMRKKLRIKEAIPSSKHR